MSNEQEPQVLWKSGYPQATQEDRNRNAHDKRDCDCQHEFQSHEHYASLQKEARNFKIDKSLSLKQWRELAKGCRVSQTRYPVHKILTNLRVEGIVGELNRNSTSGIKSSQA